MCLSERVLELTPQNITYSKKPSNATVERTDPSQSREAAAVQAAKLVVSRAQGEYEALEKEKEKEQEGGEGSSGQKRDLDNGDEEGRAGKKAKTETQDDDGGEMEIEMDEDDDGEFSHRFDGAWVSTTSRGWRLSIDQRLG